jgi:hypothetical protein
MKRRTVLALSVIGLSTLGLCVPALADDQSGKDPIMVCVQFPGSNPTAPRAPGYCLFLPDPTAASR